MLGEDEGEAMKDSTALFIATLGFCAIAIITDETAIWWLVIGAALGGIFNAVLTFLEA